MKNSLSTENRIPFLATVVGFDYQKEQASGAGWGWRYKIAIHDFYSSSSAEINDDNIEYAICILPCTAGSGGANRGQSVKIVQGDIVTGYKMGGKRGIAFIDGVIPRSSLGGESVVKFGPGRFDAKSGFWGKNQPKNIYKNDEVNSCEGVCTPRPLNTGSGSDKSQKRETPTNKLEEMGVDPDKEPKPGEFKSPEVDPPQEDLGTIDLSNTRDSNTIDPAEAAAQRERIRQRQTVDRALGKINTGDIAVQPGGLPVNRTPTSEELQKFESNGYRFIEDEPGSGSGGRIIKRVGQNYG